MPAQRSAPKTARDRSGQAVVLGGGMAGVLAARVLADTFEQVTIIERHAHDPALSSTSRPQDDRPSAGLALAQVLSERARTQLERLFPDLSAELTTDGAAIVEGDRDGTRQQFSPQFIQRHLARRLTSLDAIATLHGCDAVGLVSDGGRCVGVQILPRSRSAAVRNIPADLVVDAMGTGSRLCLWLNEIWRIHIPSEEEQIGPVSATPARTRRRRFDRASHLLAGVVALGGSVCSFDPCNGQDLEVAVLEAAALGRILADQQRYGGGTHSIELARRYFRAVSQILDSACDGSSVLNHSVIS